MGLKKSFASKANGYQRGMKEIFYECGPVPVFLAGILGAGIGFGTTFAVDAYKPLESQPQLGQEIAVQQHQAALVQLEQQHNTLKNAQSAAHFTPQALGSIIELSEEDRGNSGAALEIQNHYNKLLNAFVTSVHVDKRLNEADAQQLLTAFENAHGRVDAVTDFKKGMDYNDLYEARAWAAENVTGSEMEIATAINERAGETNEGKTFWTIGSTTAALPFLTMILFGLMGGTLRRWERDQPKPKSGINH